MQSKTDQPPKEKRQPFQIGLSQLFQLVTVAALWCSVGVTRENVTLGIICVVGAVLATWIVVGRWAVTLSPRASKRILAATTTLLVVVGCGITAYSGLELYFSSSTEDYFPLVCLLTAFSWISLTSLAYEAGPAVGFSVGVLTVLLPLAIVYCFWSAVFGAWDRWSERPTLRLLVWSFTVFLVLLALPLLPVIFSGCYMCSGHGEGMETKHLWIHCVLHFGMLVTAGAIIGLLQIQAFRATSPPSWLKLLTLGYLCLYAVLLQVALFPINFYIP